MKTLYKIAWVGLVLSAVIHVLALLKTDAFLDDIQEFAFILHGGCIFLGFPMILCMQTSTIETNKSDIWKKSLANCPGWMKKMIGCLVVYGIVNFVYGFIENQDNASTTLRLFSGHWLIFYSLEAGIFKSFLRSENATVFNKSDTRKRIVKICAIAVIIILLFSLFTVSCFVTGNGLLFIFVFVSIWGLGLLLILNMAIGAITNSFYLKKHYPDLWKKIRYGPYSERMELVKQIEQSDDLKIKKINKIVHRIGWSFVFIWLFLVFPAICVFYFIYGTD